MGCYVCSYKPLFTGTATEPKLNGMKKPLYILHLDDHPDFINRLWHWVNKLNDQLRHIPFYHPDEALSYLETAFWVDQHIDLIMTDFNHYGMDGYEFAVAVQALELKYKRPFKIPVLMMSMAACMFHPGKERIGDCVARNEEYLKKVDHPSRTWVVKGIREEMIAGAINKNSPDEKLVELIEYLTAHPQRLI